MNTSADATIAAAEAAVLEELRSAPKLLLTTHENPDGDALGSLLGMHRALEQLGKDVLMYLSPQEFPLPPEYRHLDFRGLVGEPPEDVGERVIVFLDCGNIDRMPVDFLRENGRHIVNVDHHHDNTRFGAFNLVDPSASSTAEIVYRLARGLGVQLTPEIAEPLYVGIVTDTGRFMYENATPAAHRVAADLIEAGVNPYDVYHRVYENVPVARLRLLERALSRLERHDGGRITATLLTRTDFEEAGAGESDSEGIVEQLRAVEGTVVAVLVRDKLDDGRRGLRKVSLRTSSRGVDVSAIARAFGGGGHRQAAGFTTDVPHEEVIATVTQLLRAQLDDSA